MGIFLGNSFYNCYGSCTGIGTDRQIMPICVLFITYYSRLEVWARYPVPRGRQLPHRIGRTAWHCDDGMSWSDARRSARGAADLIKSRGPTEYCTRGGQRAKNRSCPQAPSDRPAPQRLLFATTFPRKRILMGTWCWCTSSGLA
eukprot:SAG31_NODE_262_length_18842_cov_22.033346_2_plen_144_part_00